MNPLLNLTIEALSEQLKRQAVSPVEVLEACLARIEQIEPQVHAFECVLHDSARAAARAAQAEIAAGRWRGPLHGVPVAVKDNFDMAGVPTTNSSRVRAGHVAQADSAAVASLKKAGAIIVGKTCLHEFALGGITPKSRNPWDTQCTTGGSSGGSAAAVAYQAVYLALGSDTAGSVRIPASLCGVVGLKPGFGLLDTEGLTPLSWSLDHVGVLTRSVHDAALSLRELLACAAEPRAQEQQALCAHLDAAVAAAPSLAGVRVGVPRHYFLERLHPDVERAVHAAIDALRGLGATLVDVEVPHTDWLIPLEYIIAPAESGAYHADDLRRIPEQYTEGTRRRLESGNLISASDYIRAQRVRTQLQTSLQPLFEGIDLLVTPTVPMPTVPLTPAVLDGSEVITWEDGTTEPLGFALPRFTTLGNLTGRPALSLPCGLSAEQRPIGLQLVGRHGGEGPLLRAGAAYESTRSWGSPPL